MGSLILVVEDDPQSLYLVTYLLEKSGHEVVSATDGEEGVAKARESGPDLVVMDMLLPKMDGYAATREIREIRGLEDVPVIALTAYSMEGDEQKALDAGCTGYIPKPLEPPTFVQDVERYLGDDRG